MDDLYRRFDRRARRGDALGWALAVAFVLSLVAIGTTVFIAFFANVSLGTIPAIIVGAFLVLVLIEGVRRL